MTTPSTPYSIRLPGKLVELLDRFAAKTGKSAPDLIRGAIEQSVGDEFRTLLFDRINNPQDTLQRVRQKIQEGHDGRPLDYEDFGALMYFWHWAYRSGSGFANPRYVVTLLDILADLLVFAEEKGIATDDYYLRSKLGVAAEESVVSCIRRVQMEFVTRPSISWADMLTRPLEAMSDELRSFDRTFLQSVFLPRLEELLPVAMFGAKITMDATLIGRDLEPLLPESEDLDVTGTSISLYADPLTLLISEGKHCYAFGTQSVLAFCTGIECGALQKLLEKAPMSCRELFERDQLNVAFSKDAVVIHDHGGYRLTFSLNEFSDFLVRMQAVIQGKSWKWLIERHRAFLGDH